MERALCLLSQCQRTSRSVFLKLSNSPDPKHEEDYPECMILLYFSDDDARAHSEDGIRSTAISLGHRKELKTLQDSRPWTRSDSSARSELQRHLPPELITARLSALPTREPLLNYQDHSLNKPPLNIYIYILILSVDRSSRQQQKIKMMDQLIQTTTKDKNDGQLIQTTTKDKNDGPSRGYKPNGPNRYF
ncbi:hypothetical protein STEG23_013340 [Scotinomys teguina]